MAPDRYDNRRHGVWGHWVPLVVTLTIATAGVAAWAWSQRKDDDDEAVENEHEPGLDYNYDYEHADYGDNPAYGASNDRPPQQPPRPGQAPGDDQTFGMPPGPGDVSGAGWGTRMSGALRRTPSPQQFIDSTGKSVAAGFAAAGAAMGKALASIREEDKYGDNNPWSEEADAKDQKAPLSSSKKRKTVVIVVSADSPLAETDANGYLEHASILSHIPRHNDFSKVKLFVLIYSPDLKDSSLEANTSNIPPPSLGSSYSNIGHDQAQTPGEESKNPLATSSSANPAFNAVYSQALAIVDKETMIIPFTTQNGHVHILRHLSPDVIYLQESMAGDNGSIITNLQTWLRHDVILVVGAEGGAGGLADSESEAERVSKAEKWWQRPERVGRGRGIVVVDGMRVHDDWMRRVQGME